MPIYEYKCEDCGHIFEEWQKDFENHEFPCPICSGSSHRVMSNTSFILKGSGWYVTDYGKGSSGGNGSKPKPAAASSGGNGSGNSSGGSSDSSSSSTSGSSESKGGVSADSASAS